MTEQMWYLFLQKYFTSRKWKKYYKNILFYMHCISFGLKPSFMWDFGPETVTAQYLSQFLKDLKQSSLIGNNIIVITVDDHTFIANTCYLLESLKRTPLLMDITKPEKEWTLTKSNNFLIDAVDQLKDIKKTPLDIFAMQLKNFDCLPSIFGVLLGYPLIYYFNFNYPNFSVSVRLYKVLCKFEFLNISDEFQISSFSIPDTLFSDEVGTKVNEWFCNLRSVNAVSDMFQGLKIECSNEYVNSLNL